MLKTFNRQKMLMLKIKSQTILQIYREKQLFKHKKTMKMYFVNSEIITNINSSKITSGNASKMVKHVKKWIKV